MCLLRSLFLLLCHLESSFFRPRGRVEISMGLIIALDLMKREAKESMAFRVAIHFVFGRDRGLGRVSME
jgi:hypothetical protein